MRIALSMKSCSKVSGLFMRKTSESATSSSRSSWFRAGSPHGRTCKMYSIDSSRRRTPQQRRSTMRLTPHISSPNVTRLREATQSWSACPHLWAVISSRSALKSSVEDARPTNSTRFERKLGHPDARRPRRGGYARRVMTTFLRERCSCHRISKRVLIAPWVPARALTDCRPSSLGRDDNYFFGDPGLAGVTPQLFFVTAFLTAAK